MPFTITINIGFRYLFIDDNELINMLDEYDLDDLYTIFVMLPYEIRVCLSNYFSYRVKKGSNLI